VSFIFKQSYNQKWSQRISVKLTSLWIFQRQIIKSSLFFILTGSKIYNVLFWIFQVPAQLAQRSKKSQNLLLFTLRFYNFKISEIVCKSQIVSLEHTNDLRQSRSPNLPKALRTVWVQRSKKRTVSIFETRFQFSAFAKLQKWWIVALESEKPSIFVTFATA
jgi:hypothetical protein